MVVPVPIEAELKLGLTVEVRVVRAKRHRCPSCGQRRVLYRLGAWSDGTTVGVGSALCAECAGFRA